VKIRRPRCVACVDIISCPGVEPPGRSERQKYYLHGKRGVAFFGSTAPMSKKVLSACRVGCGVAFLEAFSEPMNQKYYARPGI
jgi:hypothetical protein